MNAELKPTGHTIRIMASTVPDADGYFHAEANSGTTIAAAVSRNRTRAIRYAIEKLMELIP